jgi:hypothetical protein
MQKIYSLLRNNRQSGPYALEELLQLTLKPFDLVWVEGRSAGWSYPTEIDSLKMYVVENPKPIEKKEPVAVAHKSEFADHTPPGSSETKSKSTSVTTTAKHIYISLPAGTQIKNPEIASFLSIEEKDEESPEAKLERKAQELRNKIQAFTENKNQQKAGNDLDTKYSRSLDDIKEEYSSWMHLQQKKKNIFSKKSGLAIASVSFFIIAGYLTLPNFLSSKKDSAHVLSAEQIAASKPVFSHANQSVKSPGDTKTKLKTVKTSKKTKDKKISPVSKNHIVKNEYNKVDAYIDSLKTIEHNKQTEQVEEVTYESASNNQNGSRQSTKRNDEAVKNTATKKETGTTPFEQLIKLSESTGSGTPHLSLYNNSNKHINFVAIDVYFYKANQKLSQKKTLYFKDIPPHSSAKLFVPQGKKAASVRYEMGLISTDNGLYYAKQ